MPAMTWEYYRLSDLHPNQCKITICMEQKRKLEYTLPIIMFRHGNTEKDLDDIFNDHPKIHSTKLL